MLSQHVILLADVLLDGYEREFTILRESGKLEISEKIHREFVENRKKIIMSLGKNFICVEETVR